MVKISVRYFCLVLFVFLIGCAGSPTHTIENTIACRSLPQQAMPNWVINPQSRDSNFIYSNGVSEGLGMDFQALRQASRKDALNNLIGSLEVSIRAEVSLNNTYLAGQHNSLFEESISTSIHSVRHKVISDVIHKEAWLNHDTCQLWSQVSINIDNYKKLEKRVTEIADNKFDELISRYDERLKKTPRELIENKGFTIDQEGYLRALSQYSNDDKSKAVLLLFSELDYPYTLDTQIDVRNMEWQYEQRIGNKRALDFVLVTPEFSHNRVDLINFYFQNKINTVNSCNKCSIVYKFIDFP